MNLFVLPETHAAATTWPIARGCAPKAPIDDFALMLAESAAALRPEKPAPLKDAPRDPEPVDEADATPAPEAHLPPAKPDAPPEIDDDADREPGEDASADAAQAPITPSVSEAANQALAAAASATANAAATAAAGVVENATAEGAAQTVAVDASAAMLITEAFAAENASEQVALPQTAQSAAPTKPAATPATVPVTADAPAAQLSVSSLLVTAPEPALPGDATQNTAAAAQSTPGLATAPHMDAKPLLATQINVQSPAPSPTQPAPPALAPAAQETAAPGAGMIQAAIAAAVSDAAPDSPAPSASPAAAHAPAGVPQAGPGHAPASPAEHVTSVQTPAAPTAPTLDNVTQYVVRSVRLMVHDGQKTLTVRLIPPSLGELHLEVSSVRDNLYVRLMSANPVVRDALESQLTSLRDTLARSGVDAASVTVSSGSTAGQASQNLFDGGRQDGGSARLDLQPEPDLNAAAGHESSRRSTGHQGLIDVFV